MKFVKKQVANDCSTKETGGKVIFNKLSYSQFKKSRFDSLNQNFQKMTNKQQYPESHIISMKMYF